MYIFSTVLTNSSCISLGSYLKVVSILGVILPNVAAKNVLKQQIFRTSQNGKILLIYNLHIKQLL